MDIDLAQSLSVELYWANEEILQPGYRFARDSGKLSWVALWMVHQGTLQWKSGDRAWQASAGDAVLWPLSMAREITCVEPVVTSTVGFHARLFGKTGLLHLLELPIFWRPRAGDWLALRTLVSLLIYDELSPQRLAPPAHYVTERPCHLHADMPKGREHSPDTLLRDGIARTLVGLCWRMLGGSDLPSPGRQDIPAWLAHALQRIHECPGIHVAELAYAAGYSLPQFRRLFQRYLHISPQGYVQQYRLRAARMQLETTEFSVGEIAERLGFASGSDFTRFFRHLYGCAPTEYRKATRQRE